MNALTAIIMVCILSISFLMYFPSPFFVKANTIFNEKNFPKYTSSALSNIEKKATDNKSRFKIAPEFEKTGEIINIINNNNQPLTMTNLKGKVVLVNFWTYSCINVLRTLPHIIDWNTKYEDNGLVVVGVHTPEFEFEKNIDNVKVAVQKYGIKYQILQDNEFKTWNAYGNSYWPRIYLVDAQGYIRYDKIGEGEYNQTEKVIQSLLSERNSNKGMKNSGMNTTFSYDNKTPLLNTTNNIRSFLDQEVDYSKIKTPELYFGNQSSSSSIGNAEVFHPWQIVTYTIPSSNSTLKPNTIYLEGKWKNNHDNVELQSDTGRIILNYYAKSVNLVAGGAGQGLVHEDNSLISHNSQGVDTKNDSKFTIDYPRLYNIINNQSYDGVHSLIIDIKGKGFQAYVFTFG